MAAFCNLLDPLLPLVQYGICPRNWRLIPLKEKGSEEWVS
jgi:hypothetical protein